MCIKVILTTKIIPFLNLCNFCTTSVDLVNDSFDSVLNGLILQQETSLHKIIQNVYCSPS